MSLLLPGGTWSSSNGNASVDNAGLVTGITSGTSVLTFIETNNRVLAIQLQLQLNPYRMQAPMVP